MKKIALSYCSIFKLNGSQLRKTKNLSILFPLIFMLLFFTLPEKGWGQRLIENFTGCSASTHASPGSTDISGSLNSYLSSTGWTGSKIYQAGGEIKLGSASAQGYIITKAIDLSGNSGAATLTFDLCYYGSDAAVIQVFHAPDGTTFSQVGGDITAPASYTAQTISITGGLATSKIKIAAKNSSNCRFFLDNISIFQNCASPYTIFSEGFEGTFLPTGWQQYDCTGDASSNNWIQGATYYYEGTKSAWINYDASYEINHALETPQINLTGYTNSLLNFYVNYSGQWGDHVYVEISTNGGGVGGTWTQLADYAGYGNSSWLNERISLSTYDGNSNIHIRFRSYQPYDNNSNGVDLVVITGCSSCTSPTISSQPSTSPQTICQNGTATALSVTASPETGYQWYSNTSSSNSGGTLLSGSTSASYTPLTTVAGTLYYYCVVSNSSCTTTSNVSGAVTINAVPTASNFSASGSTVCTGTGSVITVSSTSLATGAYTVTYNVSGTNTVSSTTATMSFTSGSPGSGTFTTSTLSAAGTSNVVNCTAIAYTSALSCTYSLGASTAAFTTNASPGTPSAPTNVTATPSSICQGSSAYLTASNGTNGTQLNWYTTCGGSSIGTGYITVTPSSTTTYYVASSNSCATGTCASVTVTVNSIPSAPGSASGTNYCSGSSGTLTASSVPGGCTVNWYSGGCSQNFIGSGNPIAVSVTQNDLDNAGIYYYAQSVSSSGCVSSSCTQTTSPVYVYGPPAIISQPSNQICGQTWSSGHYFAVGASGDAGTFQWYYSTDHTNWTTVTNSTPSGITYSGGTTNFLTITGSSVPVGTYYYRCGVTGSVCSGNTVYSNYASLSVTANTIWYYRASSGNWSTTSNWSNTSCSSGTASSSYPQLSSDVVYICSGKTVNIDVDVSVWSVYNSGTLTISNGHTLTNNGTFNNFYGVYVDGTINNNGTYNEEYETIIGYDQSGTFNNNNGAICNIVNSASYQGYMLLGISGSITGTFDNKSGGTLNIYSQMSSYHSLNIVYGALNNEGGGTVNNNGGYWSGSSISEYGIYYNYSSTNSYNYGTINNYLNIGLASACTLNNGDGATNNGTYNNYGWTEINHSSFNNKSGSTYNENGETDISGVSAHNGSIHNYSGGIFNVRLITTGYGIIEVMDNYSSFTNDNGGTVTNYDANFPGIYVSAGSFTNNGTLSDYGSIYNAGTFTNGTSTNAAVFNYYATSGSITGSGSGHYFVYGTNAALNYLGTTAQTTSNYELPSTNMPNYVTINNTTGNGGGVTLHANRTIGNSLSSGTSLTLTNGALILNNFTLTVDNSATTAISRNGTTQTGYIVSETENSKLQWNIGTNTGIFTYPFGRYSSSLKYIPIVFTKNSGTGTGNIAIATYHSPDYQNLPLPSAVYNIVGSGQLNNSTNILDRWWIITPSSYTGLNADVVFNYETDEFNSPNTIIESNLKAQHWNTTTGSWDSPVGTVDIINHKVSVSGATAFLPWTLVNNQAPLPVELLSFSANCDNKRIKINWSTASEVNSDYFKVEKSRDNNIWDYITTVPGAGNSNTKTDYAVDDEVPYTETTQGIEPSYYRLLQVDFDGNIKHYGPVASICKEQNLFNAYVDENKNIEIIFKAFAAQPYTISLLDYNGKKVMTISGNANEGLNNAILNTNSLSAGLYVLIYKNGNDYETRKIVLY